MRAAWNFIFLGFGVFGASYAGLAPASAPARHAADAKTLFQGQCAKCHSGEHPAGGVDLSGDLDAVAMSKAIVRGRPHASSVYKLIKDGSMPKGAPKMSDEDINTIRDWIMSLRPNPMSLFTARCAGCHSGGSPAAALNLTGNLEALAKLPQAKFGDDGATTAVLYKRIADGSMPKGGAKFTDDELSVVKDWLNSTHPDPRALFKEKCVKCHSGDTAAAKLDLSGDLDALAGLKQVVKGKPAESALYQRCIDGTMPRGGKPLTDSESGLVWDWIKSLAPKP